MELPRDIQTLSMPIVRSFSKQFYQEKCMHNISPANLNKSDTNQYTNITDYCDLWVTSGYYDYQIMANDAKSTIGDSRKILELGVGTGLLATSKNDKFAIYQKV